ncbi:Eco57I restriction-modification methylase domain-containing protein [Salinibaculum salinum]|uniref:Eco57I restriction-modification methylase domain-containing protein n=1 Tax=Salinibaculum salinum TaxID=3131996 RepID=UPI0030ECF0C8
MKGFVETPTTVTQQMVSRLFDGHPPAADDRILFPGCGETAPFIQAVADYCAKHSTPMPEGVAFETHPDRCVAASQVHSEKPVTFRNEDFLQNHSDLGEFEYIVGNPPYVPIENIEQKDTYRDRFQTAEGRFDLYILFYEQAIELLADGGRLCFITPEKFEYTETAGSLRQLLTTHHVESIEHLSEDAFPGYITYPTVSTIAATEPGPTKVIRRDGSTETVTLPTDGSSWAATIRDVEGATLDSGVTLGDVTERVSCGIATGRDGIFVKPDIDQDGQYTVPPQLVEDGWTYPTISGKQLRANGGPHPEDVIICPYDDRGNLIAASELGAFGDWASLHRDELESRSCVKTDGKPWYSWHETPPMEDIIGQDKILCSDVAKEPEFWLDDGGEILPRHSVYYIVPDPAVDQTRLLSYLNGAQARAWLEANCQRASSGYLRLQSTVLKELPVPEELGQTKQTTIT